MNEHGKQSEPRANRPKERECAAPRASVASINERRPIDSLMTTSRNLIAYAAILARSLGQGSASAAERVLNKDLVGYPHNHVYRLRAKRLIPNFSLYERMRAVTPAYPPAVESLLDVGCCRGYFVLDAARQASCRMAVGIDVHEPFVAISNRVSRHLEMSNTAFHHADLQAVSDRPEDYKGPFQVVVMLNTYHYAYWGSERYPAAFHDHHEILRRLARICTERLIFSARLEVDRLPSFVRQRAVASGHAADYTMARFLDAAAEFFDVRVAASGRGDPVLLMSKRR